MHSNAFERWLPVRLRFNGAGSSAIWLDFGSKSLSEPFYDQTVGLLRTSVPAAAERHTSIEEMLQVADSFSPIPPAGIIFHISRCGSTLLTNALRASGECTTLSEAPIFSCLVRQDAFPSNVAGLEDGEAIRARLLQATVSLYTSCFGLPVVIKAHTATILHIARLRAVWPSVPFVINIRNPVEVISSNLAMPSDWLRSMLAPYGEENDFGFSGPETRQMTVEEYCARGLGKFLEAAGECDHGCRVIDYAQIDIASVYDIASFLKVEMPATSAAQIAGALATYSKDPSAAQLFDDDRDWKQSQAPETVHKLAQKWANDPYRRLCTRAAGFGSR